MKRKLLFDLNMGMFFMAGSLLALSSCTDEDTGGGKEVEQKTGEYFIAVKSSQGSREYVMQAETLEGGDLNISDNVRTSKYRIYMDIQGQSGRRAGLPATVCRSRLWIAAQSGQDA